MKRLQLTYRVVHYESVLADDQEEAEEKLQGAYPDAEFELIDEAPAPVEEAA